MNYGSSSFLETPEQIDSGDRDDYESDSTRLSFARIERRAITPIDRSDPRRLTEVVSVSWPEDAVRRRLTLTAAIHITEEGSDFGASLIPVQSADSPFEPPSSSRGNVGFGN